MSNGQLTGRILDGSGNDITGRATGARIAYDALAVGATGYQGAAH